MAAYSGPVRPLIPFQIGHPFRFISATCPVEIGRGFRPESAPHHPDRFSHEFDSLVKKSKLPRIRLHDLRHTYATLLLQQGINVKVVSERLGHSSAAFTMDVYQHVLPSMQQEAANAGAAAVFGT
jgi:integrase